MKLSRIEKISRLFKPATIVVIALLCLLGIGNIAQHLHPTAQQITDLVSAQTQPFYPGSTTSLLPNYPYPVMTFTATSQTLKQPLSGQSYATISITGATFTTATFTIKGSNDKGVNFYPLAVAPYPVSGGSFTPTVSAITVTSPPALYVVNVAGFTNIEIVTSGTFTATSMSAQITGTSNKGNL